jgi:predicted MFS family arabinose efflux permease
MLRHQDHLDQNDLQKGIKPLFSALVILSIFGFFVDSFNLALFQIVRIPSLQDLNSTQGDLLSLGGLIMSIQMTGVFLGGFIWGPLSDKMGRVRTLKYAVITYAIACIANAFVTNLTLYGICRFIAGIGMAGEFGISVSLASESLPKHLRGYAIVLISALGTLGFVFAGSLAPYLTWRELYFVGGVLGFVVCLSRLRLKESSAFEVASSATREETSGILFFFTNKERLLRFLRCVTLGLPTWFANAILLTFCYEIGLERHLELSADKAFMICMPFAVAGDLFLGFLSQYLRSRRKVMGLGLIIGMIAMSLCLYLPDLTPTVFYILLAIVFFAFNFWGLFITTTVEQFGTNVRATASTLAPNFVRGSIILITFGFTNFASSFRIIDGAFWIGTFLCLISLLSLYFMKETSENDIAFVENNS